MVIYTLMIDRILRDIMDTIELNLYNEFKERCKLHDIHPEFVLEQYIRDFIMLDEKATQR